MPKVSKESAAHVEDHGPVEDRHEDLDGYTVNFVTIQRGRSTRPRCCTGCPDDSCQCPHWGYVFKGRITFSFADHEEVFEAGDAFYIPPGHVPRPRPAPSSSSSAPAGPADRDRRDDEERTSTRYGLEPFVLAVRLTCSYLRCRCRSRAANEHSDAAAQLGPRGNRRGVGLGFVLFVITLGFYGWYWAFKTQEETEAAHRRRARRCAGARDLDPDQPRQRLRHPVGDRKDVRESRQAVRR